MAFVAVNGYDVEHASSMLVMENLFPKIQHINNKGVIDKYTPSNAVESVTYIDVLRVLSYVPNFRQLGATNNGKFHNKANEGGYNNAPQSTHYTIPVDLIFDRGVPITDAQIYSNPVALKQVVMGNLVDLAAQTINIITFAKQFEGYFRNGDNFDKGLTHDKGSIVNTDISDDEIANAIFSFDPAVAGLSAGSPTLAFQNANASLDDGIPEIGAYVVDRDKRQAFITPQYNTLMKGQYAQNASEAAARILATGYINPFNADANSRPDAGTGLCGQYDGVDMFIWNKTTRLLTYIALGILGTANDAASDLATCRTALDKVAGFVIYGAGTCRGIVGPSITANPNPFFGGVYILPKMKVGVNVLHGATIKMIVNAGTSLASAWTKANIATLMNTLTFTPIDGDTVTGLNVIPGFNDGTTN